MTRAPDPPPVSDLAARRVRASLVSVAAGTAIFAGKLAAWALTGSTAVLSDALESVVNVVAALFAWRALRFAAAPADRDHPYGHGKAEHLAAAFEGGLIAAAALLIVYQAGRGLLVGPELRQLDLGISILAGAAAANAALGLWLRRTGRRLESPTLVADGTHVLADVWTTAGILVGLGLVRATGLVLLDPLAALVVGLLLARTGIRLVRQAASALIDAEDPALLRRLVEAYNECRVPGIGGLHHLRALRHGDSVHVDAHVFVPADWPVREAHEAARTLARAMAARSGLRGEFALHLDPCEEERCARCPLAPSGSRGGACNAPRPVTLAEALASRHPHAAPAAAPEAGSEPGGA